MASSAVAPLRYVSSARLKTSDSDGSTSDVGIATNAIASPSHLHEQCPHEVIDRGPLPSRIVHDRRVRTEGVDRPAHFDDAVPHGGGLALEDLQDQGGVVSVAGALHLSFDGFADTVPPQALARRGPHLLQVVDLDVPKERRVLLL